LLAALPIIFLVQEAGSVPPPPVGAITYSQTQNDCVTGDDAAAGEDPIIPDPNCDDYNTDYYERPLDNSNQDIYFRTTTSSRLPSARTRPGSTAGWTCSVLVKAFSTRCTPASWIRTATAISTG
jgi:hypothetical protein